VVPSKEETSRTGPLPRESKAMVAWEFFAAMQKKKRWKRLSRNKGF